MTTILITAVILEIFTRLWVGYQYPFIILYAELIVIGIALTVETVTFLWLSRRIFEGDFTEEQRFFKVSLAVFISTYALRCVLLMLIIFLWSIYEGWFESMPIFAATVQSICHMVYDSVPVVYIMLRHKRIFQNEEK